MRVRFKHNYLLVFCVLVVGALCVASIWQPIRFERMRTEREQVVKRRLADIRRAEEKYHATAGRYTADFDSLVAGGYLADSLQYIPYTPKKRFELYVTMQLAKSGRQIALMECRAPFTDYLQGLDKQHIVRLIEQESAAGRYPGLKIGDITTPNNNAGNWE